MKEKNKILDSLDFIDIECKRCSMEDILSFEQIKTQIPEYLESIDEDVRVTDEEYRVRLELCFECEGLSFGVTCKYCGCFVQMRALNINRHCPSPLIKLW